MIKIDIKKYLSNIKSATAGKYLNLTIKGCIFIALVFLYNSIMSGEFLEVLDFIKSLRYGFFNKNGTLGEQKLISTIPETKTIKFAATAIKESTYPNADSGTGSSYLFCKFNGYRVEIYTGNDYLDTMDLEKQKAIDQSILGQKIQEENLEHIGVSESALIEEPNPKSIAVIYKKDRHLDYTHTYENTNKNTGIFDSVVSEVTFLSMDGSLDHLMGDFIRTGDFNKLTRFYNSSGSEEDFDSQEVNIKFNAERFGLFIISGENKNQLVLDIGVPRNESIETEYMKHLPETLRKALIPIWLFPRNCDKIIEELKSQGLINKRDESFIRAVATGYCNTLPKVDKPRNADRKGYKYKY